MCYGVYYEKVIPVDKGIGRVRQLREPDLLYAMCIVAHACSLFLRASDLGRYNLGWQVEILAADGLTNTALRRPSGTESLSRSTSLKGDAEHRETAEVFQVSRPPKDYLAFSRPFRTCWPGSSPGSAATVPRMPFLRLCCTGCRCFPNCTWKGSEC